MIFASPNTILNIWCKLNNLQKFYQTPRKVKVDKILRLQDTNCHCSMMICVIVESWCKVWQEILVNISWHVWYIEIVAAWIYVGKRCPKLVKSCPPRKPEIITNFMHIVWLPNRVLIWMGFCWVIFNGMNYPKWTHVRTRCVCSLVCMCDRALFRNKSYLN